jgi:hypothetical protein
MASVKIVGRGGGIRLYEEHVVWCVEVVIDASVSDDLVEEFFESFDQKLGLASEPMQFSVFGQSEVIIEVGLLIKVRLDLDDILSCLIGLLTNRESAISFKQATKLFSFFNMIDHSF